MKATIIGDVHGKVERYKEITDNCNFSICVGDFGFEQEWRWHRKNISAGNHMINMGNHDYLPFLNDDASLENYFHFNLRSIFSVRGAESIDKHLRTEGLDWFPNEELTYQEGLAAVDAYVEAKPRIVISHDCPQSILESLFKMGWSYGKSQTRQLLQAMFEAHQPEYWFFGHHHEHRDSAINGTRFICLGELETFELEV